MLNSTTNSTTLSNDSSTNRRDFLKRALGAWIALPVFGALIAACEDKGSDTPPAGETAVKEEDPIATSLGYKADATKVDTDKYPKRKGPEGEKQTCKNCQFYTAKGDSGWGTCQILRSGLVKGAGWCNTWAPKAGG